MEPVNSFSSRIVAIANENIDTDQIIPARFLKGTSKAGMGTHLFADWRYSATGEPRPDFFLNQPAARGACILLAGDNFGCGSSREHAPWAIVDFGFRAVISSSFADIFRSNALKNGLLPIVVDRAAHEQLFSLVAEDPAIEIVVDLPNQCLRLPGGQTVAFPIDAFSRTCLLEGTDQLGYLLKRTPLIEAYENSHPAPVATSAH